MTLTNRQQDAHSLGLQAVSNVFSQRLLNGRSEGRHSLDRLMIVRSLGAVDLHRCVVMRVDDANSVLTVVAGKTSVLAVPRNVSTCVLHQEPFQKIAWAYQVETAPVSLL